MAHPIYDTLFRKTLTSLESGEVTLKHLFADGLGFGLALELDLGQLLWDVVLFDLNAVGNGKEGDGGGGEFHYY